MSREFDALGLREHVTRTSEDLERPRLVYMDALRTSAEDFRAQ
jgi:hypothetical protein